MLDATVQDGAHLKIRPAPARPEGLGSLSTRVGRSGLRTDSDERTAGFGIGMPYHMAATGRIAEGRFGATGDGPLRMKSAIGQSSEAAA